jgi:hypothetical protein
MTDSDVVIELAAPSGSRRIPDAAPARLVQEAIEASYRALAGSTRLQLDTVAVLEEISRKSLSLWLRVQTGAEGSTAAADPSQLKFLARGTLAILAWMDGSSTHQLADLQQAIRVLAWGTSITTPSQPVLPSSAQLIEAVTAWQRAKEALSANDRARVITNNGSADIDASKRIGEPRTLLQSRTLVNQSADMIFVVEMPDYQSTNQWQLKHGSTRTTAIAEPGTLLDRFYRRELDIRPGDALRCRVDVETSYGPDHEVLAERYRIVEILEVLPGTKLSDEAAVTPVEPAPAPVPMNILEDASS